DGAVLIAGFMVISSLSVGTLLQRNRELVSGIHRRVAHGGRERLKAAPQGVPGVVTDRRHHLRLSLAPERQRLLEGPAPGRRQVHIALALVGPALARHQARRLSAPGRPRPGGASFRVSVVQSMPSRSATWLKVSCSLSESATTSVNCVTRSPLGSRGLSYSCVPARAPFP